MLSNKTLFIGLTGSIGTGKSTVTRYLKSKGLPVIDADVLAKRCLEVGAAGHAEVVETFGVSYLAADGTIDRVKLGERVFSDESARVKLNAIVHPKVRAMMWEAYEALSASHPIVFADVPLLIESEMTSIFDSIWVVYATYEQSLKRIVARDGCSTTLAAQKLNAQMSIEDKIAFANTVVYNDTTTDELYEQIDRLLAALALNID